MDLLYALSSFYGELENILSTSPLPKASVVLEEARKLIDLCLTESHLWKPSAKATDERLSHTQWLQDMQHATEILLRHAGFLNQISLGVDVEKSLGMELASRILKRAKALCYALGMDSGCLVTRQHDTNKLSDEEQET
jgi:hypothetical protein